MARSRTDSNDDSGDQAVTNSRVEPQRYSEGSGFEAGNRAPHTVYVSYNDDGSEGGTTTDAPERGRVLVYEGDVVTPAIARQYEDSQSS